MDAENRLELERLRALAHPLRMQVLDALSTYGPATASGLAVRFDESSGVLSYHLRQLEKHGFIEEIPERGTARERWWRRIPRPISINPMDYPEGSAGRDAGRVVVAEWERHRRALLDAFYRDSEAELASGWMASSQLLSSTLRLTAEQALEFNTALVAVADDYIDRYRGQTGPGTRPVHLDINLFPVVDAKEAQA